MLYKKIVSAKQLFLKIWYRMPIDGTGLIRLGPHVSRHFQRVLAHHRWKILPVWARPFGFLTIRIAWIFICPIQTFIAVHRSRLPIPWKTALYTIWLGWTRGKSPLGFIAAYPSIGTSTLANYRRAMLINQLDDRQGSLLFASLAGKNDIALAADKLKCTDALRELNIPVAPILIELTRQTSINFLASPWIDYRKFFIKPRAGSGSQGAMSVEKLENDRYKISRATAFHHFIISQKEFFVLLKMEASKGSLLVQPFLFPPSSTFDISEETPPLLRIFVYRSPGGQAQHLSTAFKVQRLGKDAESNVNNVLMAPIDPETSILLSGVFVNSTDEKFNYVPWNGAQLKGRFVPEFKQAVEMVLRGSTLFSDVPLLGWDVILSEQGPVILEANIGVSLSRSQLWHYESGVDSPLLSTLFEWTKVKKVTKGWC